MFNATNDVAGSISRLSPLSVASNSCFKARQMIHE